MAVNLGQTRAFTAKGRSKQLHARAYMRDMGRDGMRGPTCTAALQEAQARKFIEEMFVPQLEKREVTITLVTSLVYYRLHCAGAPLFSSVADQYHVERCNGTLGAQQRVIPPQLETGPLAVCFVI